ncbi:alpha-L-fucosidase [Homoserinibacter sp. GY 40078]|uniref:alpha-L-fucosidase n=1 Tax=Homoserinibacter sp. GY 40078 TaxID=2603275 RepID=UPI0011CA7ED1|nr:alpha-L-fucosidase [Homoserinibacter sp. GY 40078]TXK19388.1 alpha-L-fucosidase [Homoserinibacter sp. GY 40078]
MEHSPDVADAVLTPTQLDRLVSVRPSPRQLAWQSLEYYAFVHFGMNTMTDVEWGVGHESPSLFDPSGLDVDQWMQTFVDAGMRGAILTAKHHDGFCLWPSALTSHSVASSPWRDGAGDLVREFADSARRHGLAVGIYLSPWDRTEASYGQGAAYDDFFVGQLEELLTGYGDIFSVWFDGANGEGPNGKTQEYDWDRYYEVIRRLQPGAAISVCGPDVRWCGNEAGHTRPDEWSVVAGELRDIEQIADKSQQVDDGEFSRLVRSDDQDLGSRLAMAEHVDTAVWYPAEVNTSIRPGWFYHSTEDDAVRSPDELFGLWTSAVGGNATLLLNVPPDATGRVAAPDEAALRAFGDRIRAFRAGVLAATPTVSSGEISDPRMLVDPFGDPSFATAWQPGEDDADPWIELRFEHPTRVGGLVLREDISQGQRVEKVRVVGLGETGERELATSGVVGYQRIIEFPAETLSGVRVEFPSFRAPVALRSLGAVAAFDN